MKLFVPIDGTYRVRVFSCITGELIERTEYIGDALRKHGMLWCFSSIENVNKIRAEKQLEAWIS